MKPVVVGMVFLCAVGILIWVGVASHVPVLKLHDLESHYEGGNVQVNGRIASIEALSPLRFTVGLKGEDIRLMVQAEQTIPENFKVDIPVGVEGYFDRTDKTFYAYKVVTQCPSRYEASKNVSDSATDPNDSGPYQESQLQKTPPRSVPSGLEGKVSS